MVRCCRVMLLFKSGEGAWQNPDRGTNDVDDDELVCCGISALCICAKFRRLQTTIGKWRTRLSGKKSYSCWVCCQTIMIMALHALTRRRDLFKILHGPKALLILTLGCKSTIMVIDIDIWWSNNIAFQPDKACNDCYWYGIPSNFIGLIWFWRWAV